MHLTIESNAWVGMGFSSDTLMGDDDIYYCQKRDDAIGVVSAFSTGMSRPVNVDGSSHVSNIGANLNQNSFQCSFRRPLSVTKGGIEYNLSSDSWFILLSFGTIGGDVEQYHGASATGVAIASDQPVQFGSNIRTQFFSGAPPTMPAGIRAHAFMMFFAWGFLIPSG